MAWISHYGYDSIPGSLEEKHDAPITLYSCTMSDYHVEMSMEILTEFGAPRDPNGDLMFAMTDSDTAGNGIEENDPEIDPEPESPYDPELPMVRVEWTVDFSPMGSGSRRRPRARVRRQILRAQYERCAYCLLEFGSLVRRGDQYEHVRVEWDHKIPFSSSSGREFVAACHICNRLKASLVFRTIDDAREYLSVRRARKGWRLVAPPEESGVQDDWAEWVGRMWTFQSTVDPRYELDVAEEVVDEFGPPIDNFGLTMIYRG